MPKKMNAREFEKSVLTEMTQDVIGRLEGMVEYVDDMGHLHGSWGGLAVIPGEDMFEVIQED